MLLIGKPSISIRAIFHGYVSHNQRVYDIDVNIYKKSTEYHQNINFMVISWDLTNKHGDF